MKERPILFSAPMVRAILSGQKTQTRRVLAPRGLGFIDCCCGGTAARWVAEGDRWHCATCGGGARLTPRDADYVHCPYGQPGDRLWVRESLVYDSECGHRYAADRTFLCSLFDDEESQTGYSWDGNMPDRSVPSIHLPRRYSRITLEITGVRVERLQAINSEDAITEGIERIGGATSCTPWRNYLLGPGEPHVMNHASPAASFRSLWASINGDESWNANPWVWVVEFKRA